jgi:hypothetical protein
MGTQPTLSAPRALLFSYSRQRDCGDGTAAICVLETQAFSRVKQRPKTSREYIKTSKLNFLTSVLSSQSGKKAIKIFRLKTASFLVVFSHQTY